MNIIKQNHKILSEPVRASGYIETIARTCYKSEDKTGIIPSEDFVCRLIRQGHMAMLEFRDITVRFITNRGVSHELVRHRLFSFAQESTRYVRYENLEFIEPVWWLKATTYEKRIWMTAMENAERSYQALIREGWRAEQARDVLPCAIKTEIVVKGNLRQWRHALLLRTSAKAHPQMRELMLPLLDELKEKIPVVFDFDLCE